MGRPRKEKEMEKPAEAEKPKASKLKKSTQAENEESSPSGVDDDDKDDIIARLQEEVKLLKIEVKTLRKHVKTSPQAPTTAEKKKGKGAAEVPPATPKARRSSTTIVKSKDKGCSCKGSCSNKICGCVKKDFYCLPTCKCSESCRNQDPDNNEDKENEKVNGEAEIEAVSSPSGSESSPEVLKATDNKREKPEMDSHPEFNPMEPRRQLARSPASSKVSKVPFHPVLVEKPLPPPKAEPEEDELTPPEEINNAEVDWEQHKAQLVQCSKCSRNFYAYRLKKHEKSCIKV